MNNNKECYLSEYYKQYIIWKNIVLYHSALKEVSILLIQIRKITLC